MDAQSSEVHPLFPKPLSITKVIAPLKYKRAIVRAIENLGQVEPIKVDPRTGSDEIEVEDRRNRIEEYRSKINSYLNALDSDKITTGNTVNIGTTEDEVINFIQNVVEQRSSRIDEIITRKGEIQDRIAELESIIELLEKLETLSIDDTSMLKDTRFVKTFMGTVFPAQMQRLIWEIDEISDSRYVLIDHNISKENTLLALSVLQKDADPISDTLKTFSFSDVVIPDDVDFEGLSQSDCLNEMAKLEQEDLDLDNELDELAQSIGNDLIAAREVTNIELERISIEQKMRRTKTTCVMWAWIPDEMQEEFQTIIHTATEGNVFDVDFRKGEFDPDFTPSRVENSEFMEPMRGMVTSFGTPGLHEVDPFKFVMIFFPILFGIMFADVGHGILLLLAGLYFKRKRKGLKEEPSGIAAYAYGGANLMIIMGITSAVMGVMMNSVFGDETLLWYIPAVRSIFEHTTWDFFFIVEPHDGHTVIERNYVSLLIFSFAVGAIIILIGLLLNLYQLYYYRHSDAELYAGFTLFLTYFFIILTAVFAVAFPDTPILLTIGVILIVGNVFATLGIEAKAHGIDGLMLGVDHILALMSNTFSFGRLLAMNTIHFVLATLPLLFIDIFRGEEAVEAEGHVFHHYLDQEWPMKDPQLFLLWFIGAFIGALIVVPVETTFSTLQALRLNWVEFFGKFYKGNGIEFKPVEISRVYTAED